VEEQIEREVHTIGEGHRKRDRVRNQNALGYLAYEPLWPAFAQESEDYNPIDQQQGR